MCAGNIPKDYTHGIWHDILNTMDDVISVLETYQKITHMEYGMTY